VHQSLLHHHFDVILPVIGATTMAVAAANKKSQVQVSLPPEAVMGQSWGELQAGAAMVLSAPGMPQLQVPLTDTTATAQTRWVQCLTPASFAVTKCCWQQLGHANPAVELLAIAVVSAQPWMHHLHSSYI
jgi:hypothetical protein